MAETYKPHLTEKKKSQVKLVEKMLKDNPVIGIVNLSALPCAQGQQIKIKLKDTMQIFMTKKRLMKIAINNVKKDIPGIEKLEPYLSGIPALLVTKENPFKIFSIVKKNKTLAAAKAGDISPRELIIPAGPTEFGPGPIVGELGSLGVKAGIENGKVAIKSDYVVAKKGDEISDKKANLLAKFGIKPIEIGLSITALFENGEVLTSDILDIDETVFIEKITKAASWAFNLSIEAGIINKDNVDTLIARAVRDSRALAIERGILEKEVVEQILSKVSSQAASLKQQFNI